MTMNGNYDIDNPTAGPLKADQATPPPYEREVCLTADIQLIRSPNQWWFIAICENCGLVTSSITSGGTAIAALSDEHYKEVDL